MRSSNLIELDNEASVSNRNTDITGCNNQNVEKSGCGENVFDSHAMRCYEDNIFIHATIAIRLRIWSGQYVNLPSKNKSVFRKAEYKDLDPNTLFCSEAASCMLDKFFQPFQCDLESF